LRDRHAQRPARVQPASNPQTQIWFMLYAQMQADGADDLVR